MSFLKKMEILSMSNLTPTDTGVDGVVIWVSAGEFEGKECKHGPRLKVVLGTRITSESLASSITVTLTDPPKVIGKLSVKKQKDVLSFIDKNRDILLSYWNGKISTREMINSITNIAGG